MELPAGGLLVVIGVAEMRGAAGWLSSGEYVKAGLLVWFIGPLSTAACELAGATKVGLLVTGTILLDEEDTDGVGGTEDDGALEVAGADEGGAGCCDGVKYEVNSLVSASWVAIGSPLGLRKVTAGMIWVTMVR